MKEIIFVSFDCVVKITVKAAGTKRITVITGTNMSVSAKTGLFFKVRTIFRAGFLRAGTFAESGAKESVIEMIPGFQCSVSENLLGYGSRIPENQMSNRSFREALLNALLDHFTVI